MSKKPSPSRHFELQELAPGVYAAVARDGGHAISNAGLVDLGGRTLVFDSTMTPQAAADLRQAAVDLFGHPPTLVVNSHYHNDHIWGNQVFVPEAEIIASRRTRELITTAGKEEFEYYTQNAARQLAEMRAEFEAVGEEERQGVAMWVGYYEGLVQAQPRLKMQLPTITFEEVLELHGTQRTARLVCFSEAHTAHDTILHLPAEGIVFASDLLFVGCHPYLADGSPFQLLKTLKALNNLQARVFVPGHGPVGTAADVQLEIDYIGHCIEVVQGLIAKDPPAGHMYGNQHIPEKFAHWALPKFYKENLRFLCEYLGGTCKSDT